MIFAIYKPKGPTSHDIVDVMRKLSGEKRVGHGGTLDPLASGVLVVGIGRWATRQLALVSGGEKEYLATVRLGAESTTDDREGKLTKQKIPVKPSVAAVRKVLKKFIGDILQAPPAYSAVKIGGRAAYKIARSGRTVAPKERQVKVHDIRLLEYRWPYIQLRIVTGPGVYIRSLARDVGRGLGIGGFLWKLERTRVGAFTKENSLTMVQAEGFFSKSLAN